MPGTKLLAGQNTGSFLLPFRQTRTWPPATQGSDAWWPTAEASTGDELFAARASVERFHAAAQHARPHGALMRLGDSRLAYVDNRLTHTLTQPSKCKLLHSRTPRR